MRQKNDLKITVLQYVPCQGNMEHNWMYGGEEGHWRISLVGKKKNRTNRNTNKKRNRNCNMWLVRNTERNWVYGGEEGGWRTAGDFLLVGALRGWVGW